MKLSVANRTAVAILAVVLSVTSLLSLSLLLEFRTSLRRVNAAGGQVLGQALSAEVRRRGELLAGYLALRLVDPVYKYDLQGIGSSMNAAHQQPDVKYVYVFDRDGKIIHDGTPELALVDRVLDDEVSRRAVAADKLLVQESGDALDVAAPILLGSERLGGVRVGLSLARVHQDQASLAAVATSLAQQGLKQGLRAVFLSAALMIILSALATLFVSRALTRPIARLADYARRVGAGDYQDPPEQDRTDEIGALATAFREATERRRTAEQSLAARNRDLQQARDEAVEASRAKSVFLANMSHELRTPLNHVIGFAELLAEELEDSQADLAADARKIETSARTLLAIVQGVLDLAKLQSERMTVMLERLDLASLVADAAKEAQTPLAARGNQLEVKLAPAVLDQQIVSDKRAVAQILANLLSNAAKFTDRGQVTVEASTVDSRVRIAVTDTGIGIGADQLERIFEPFTQVDESSTRKVDGAGLGLAVSRGLAQMVGGDLVAASQPGKGSTFTLVLPRSPGR